MFPNIDHSNPVYDTIGAPLVGHPGTTITLSYDSSAATTETLEKGRKYRFWSSTDCYFKMGTGTPTADSGDTPLTAKLPDYFTPLLDDVKVAAVKMSEAGVLSITPMYREGETPV